MQSDNGTNFIGIVMEINDAIKNLKYDKITTYLNKHQMKWQFNSPLSPWMEGCWESLIETIRRCLCAILKNSITTVETLTSVLCEVEYIVNNLPLLPISDDINDYDVLTPNNSLLGHESCNVNIEDGMQTDQINYRQKWKQVQSIANMY